METQPLQMQHQADTGIKAKQPRDLTWLGMADDRELICLAREIAAQTPNADGHAAKVCDSKAAKLDQ